MSVDLYLYAAFGIGLVGGWAIHPTTPWVERATIATVLVLVGLLGGSLSGLPLLGIAETLPLALGFTGAILGVTVAVVLALERWKPDREGPRPPPRSAGRVPLSVLLLAALVAGFVLGHAIALPYSPAIPWSLALLLGLVAFGLRFEWASLRRAWVPLAAAVTAAGGVVVVVAVVFPSRAPVVAATAFGFGWYTLAGPLVAERAGAALGLFAFLSNFFRENLTMVLAPLLGRRVRGDGLAAMGGATSMDTTLYFVTRYGDELAGGTAIASGLVLTISAGLLLPLILAL